MLTVMQAADARVHDDDLLSRIGMLGEDPGGRDRDGPGGVHRGRPRERPVGGGRRLSRLDVGVAGGSAARPAGRGRPRGRAGAGRGGRGPGAGGAPRADRLHRRGLLTSSCASRGSAAAVVGPAVAMKLRRPAIVGVLLAVLLTVLAALGPPAAGPIAPFLAAIDAPVALAADDLGVTTKARYVVVPQNGVIRVAVDVAVVNQKPNRVSGGVITRYFYDSVNLGVQVEATHLRATQDGAPVRVTSAVRRGFRLVTISFRNDIYVGETAHVRLQFDLPAGAPRSDSDVRVGPAFATFLAWAFGDRGSVRIDVPKAFDVDISGEDMEASTTGGLEGVHGDDRRRARLVRLGQRPQRRRAHARAAGPRRRRAGRRPRLARGLALATSRVGDPLRQRARPRRPDRPPVAGRRPAQRARGPHPAARGLRRLLRPQERRDHDQREPRRPDHRPRGLARLVQQPPVHRPLDQRGAGRGVRVAGARGGDARQGRPGAGQALRQGRVPPRALGPARADPRRAERRPRAVRVRRRLDRDPGHRGRGGRGRGCGRCSARPRTGPRPTRATAPPSTPRCPTTGAGSSTSPRSSAASTTPRASSRRGSCRTARPRSSPTARRRAPRTSSSRRPTATGRRRRWCGWRSTAGGSATPTPGSGRRPTSSASATRPRRRRRPPA